MNKNCLPLNLNKNTLQMWDNFKCSISGNWARFEHPTDDELKKYNGYIDYTDNLTPFIVFDSVEDLMYFVLKFSE